jgi:hypothetical protein
MWDARNQISGYCTISNDSSPRDFFKFPDKSPKTAKIQTKSLPVSAKNGCDAWLTNHSKLYSNPLEIDGAMTFWSCHSKWLAKPNLAQSHEKDNNDQCSLYNYHGWIHIKKWLQMIPILYIVAVHFSNYIINVIIESALKKGFQWYVYHILCVLYLCSHQIM